MLFGGSRDAENIPIRALTGALSQSFDKKLASLDAKASRIADNISQSKRVLEAACGRFGELQKEPDTEYVRANSKTYVKEQKGAYTSLLKRILAVHLQEGAEGNTYERYYSIMQDTGALLNEVLKANTSFRMVLDAYPNDLGELKKAFSSIEIHWRALSYEIEARNGDLREYKHLLGEIRRLIALGDEAKSVQAGIAELGSKESKKADTEEISRLEQKIGALRMQKEAIARKMSELGAERGVILSTIEKPARKHDYLSLYKPKITPLLSNPALLEQEERYGEFYSQVEEIKEEIEKGVISVKNADEVRRAIRTIMEGRIKAIMESVEEMRSNKLPIESEIRDLERMLQELRSIASGALQREVALESMKKKTEEIKGEQSALTGKIELLFLNYYRRRIKIV